MNISKLKKKNSNKSFTLLEVILAIFILTVAVAGSFVLIQQTLISASLNQSKLIAYYLAQEGVELVRNIRDTNWLKGQSWAQDMAPGQGYEYEADYNDTALEVNDRPLMIDSASGFYSYSGDVETKFKRKISIASIDQSGLGVTVTVSWSERGASHNVEAAAKLYNWYGQ